MKKLSLILVLALAGVVLSQAKPRWHTPDAWRKGVRNGLLDERLFRILGRPAYVRIVANSSLWYYESAPKCVPMKDNKTDRAGRGKKLENPDTGIVICENVAVPRSYPIPRPVRPRYLVQKWVEPDWKSIDLTKDNTERQPKKRKLLRKSKRWENPLAWKRLMIGMSIRSAEKLIGEAARERVVESSKQWYYGDVQECGILGFKNNQLTSWNEPFWPEVDKTLYAVVESKRVLVKEGE